MSLDTARTSAYATLAHQVFGGGYGAQRSRRSRLVFFFEIDQVSVAAAAVGDAARRVNFNIGLVEHSLDVRKSPKIIVALDQKSMLGASHRPPQLPGKLNEGIAAVREDGQLEVIGAERYRA